MKVIVNGQSYHLNQNNSVSGGEGTVYVEHGKAFKIYHDPKKMIPLGKFQELQNIKNPNVIKPEELIYDYHQNIIGYTMKPLYNTVSLSRVLTTDYQNGNSISHNDLINIMLSIKKLIEDIHNAKCLMVDINDSNILVDKDLNVYIIDVDSFQTPNYKATALQEYAKDFSVKNYQFSELSDWYSFALLSFRLLIGIHPFLGRWSKYNKKDIQNSLEYRSTHNISILNPEVVFPKSVRDFSFIPKHYYQWFIELFEKGKRLNPPNDIGSIVSNAKDLIISLNQTIQFKKIAELNKNIKQIYSFFNQTVYLNESSVFFNNQYTSITKGKKVIIFNQKNEPLLLKINSSKLESYNLVTHTIKLYDNIEAEDIFVFYNTLFIKNQSNFTTYSLLNFSEDFFAVKQNITIMPFSSHVYDGCIYQNTMNKAWFYLVHDKETLPIVKINELDSKKIINAKYMNQMLYVVYEDNNEYIHKLFKMNHNFSEYKLIMTQHLDHSHINLTVNEKGIVLFSYLDNLLYVYFNHYENDKFREIQDNNFFINMNLFSKSSSICIYINNEVYQISLS